jgi:tetraacyldisaccharide 4'-kinase
VLPGAIGQRALGAAWPLGAWLHKQPGAAVDLASLRGRPLLAVAGLAAPQKFFDMLGAAGLTFATLPLPDHHAYATLPWPAATPDVLTTEKDAVKISPAALRGTRVWVLPLDFHLPPGLAGELLTWLPAPQPKTPLP